jgi:hypothetical protein
MIAPNLSMAERKNKKLTFFAGSSTSPSGPGH